MIRMLSKTRILIRLLVIVLALILPLVFEFIFFKNNVTFYQNMSQHESSFEFIDEQINNNEKDIDIAFFGTSATWLAINAPEYQDLFKKSFGKDLRIYNYSALGHYEDRFYTMTKDILQRKKIKLAIVEMIMSRDEEYEEHPQTFYFINLFKLWPMLKHLNFSYQMRYFGYATIGWPRQVLGYFFNNSRHGLTKDYEKQNLHLIANLGSRNQERGFAPRSKRKSKKTTEFKEFNPPIPKVELNHILHNGGPNDPRLSLESYPFTPSQEAMMHDIFEMIQSQHGKMAFIDPDNDILNAEQVYWRSRTYDPAIFAGQHIPLIKVKNQDLYRGLSTEEQKLLSVDEYHRNINGSRLYARLTFPALEALFREAINEK